MKNCLPKYITGNTNINCTVEYNLGLCISVRILGIGKPNISAIAIYSAGIVKNAE